MTKYIETTGKTEELAVAAALEQLGLERDDVSVEVIARAKTGFLGIGSSPAKVRVSYEAPDEEEAAPAAAVAEDAPKAEEPAPAPAAEEKPKAEKKPAPKKEKAEKPAAEKKAAPSKTEAPAPAAEAKPADRTADIQQFLIGLLAHLEVEAKPAVTVNAEGTYEVVLEGEDLGALIGRRGETLDAIQQLTNYAVNHGQHSRTRIHVDCENYRAKREESLQRLAHKTADKAVKYRRNMMLEPMNAYERHVIHAELQEYHPNISTYSIGTEPNRRIVVAYNK